MTETDRSSLVPSGTALDPGAVTAPEPAAAQGNTPLVWMCAAAVLLLAAGEMWLWRHQTPPPAPPPAVAETAPTAPGDLDAVTAEMRALTDRVAALERRPALDPAPLRTRLDALEKRPVADLAPVQGRLDTLEKRALPDLTALARRLDVLERRPVPADQSGYLTQLDRRLDGVERRPTPDLAPLEHRLEGLEERQANAVAATGDLAPLAARVAALENGSPSTPAAGTGAAPAPDLAPLRARLDALAARMDARMDAVDAAGAERARVLEARLAAGEARAQQMPAVAEQARRLAQIDLARQALDDGRPLGDIPDATPAVTRFATAAPPTQAALRLAFVPAAQAALEASQPAEPGQAPLLDRAWARAKTMLTVRQGDRVLLGDPAAAILGQARQAIEVGDLSGAVAAIASLQGPAAQAMAPWLDQARAVLDARAGLAEMAAHA